MLEWIHAHHGHWCHWLSLTVMKSLIFTKSTKTLIFLTKQITTKPNIPINCLQCQQASSNLFCNECMHIMAIGVIDCHEITVFQDNQQKHWSSWQNKSWKIQTMKPNVQRNCLGFQQASNNLLFWIFQGLTKNVNG